MDEVLELRTEIENLKKQVEELQKALVTMFGPSALRSPETARVELEQRIQQGY